MTLHPETIARVRGHIARNLRLGQSWDDMRRNANASAARLGAEIAATITSPSEANDKRLAELFERAADMRAQYDEPFSLENLQRFAQRCARNPEFAA